MKETVVCPLCGEKLNYSLYTNKTRRTTPSVDRIDNELIMTVENTWIICYACNAAKGDMTIKEFKEYISKVNRSLKNG